MKFLQQLGKRRVADSRQSAQAFLDVLVESLESRRMLAASLSVDGMGNAVVTGTAGMDAISVFVSGTVMVADGTTVQDTGLATLNSLYINALDGDDVVSVVGVSTGAMVINTGAGNDFLNTEAINVSSSAIALGSDGVDTFLLGGQVGGDLSVSTGFGSGVVLLSGTASDLTVVGNLTVSGSTDADSFVSGFSGFNTNVGGNLVFNPATGNDVVVFGAAAGATNVAGDATILGSSGDNVIVTSAVVPLIVGGKLSISSAGGADAIVVQNTIVAGDVSVSSGTGTNNIVVNNVFVGGNASITGGQSVDNISIANATFANSLAIKTLGADDGVTFDVTTAIMSGGYALLTIDGGSGALDVLAPDSMGVAGTGTAFFLTSLGSTILGFEIV